MSGDDQLRPLLLGKGVFLQHRSDTDAAVSQNFGNLGQHPGLVGNVQPDVVPGLQVVNGLDREGLFCLDYQDRRLVGLQPSTNVDQVSNDGTGSGPTPGAHTVEQHLPHLAAGNFHRIIHSIYFGQHMVDRDQRRMHSRPDLTLLDGGNCQWFDGISQFLGVTKVLGLQIGYPLAVNVLRGDSLVEGQRG